AVFPAIVDTPGFAHGANVSGKRLDPGPFLYRPEDVAETFVDLVRHPQDETTVGWPSAAARMADASAPRLTEHRTGAVCRRLLAQVRPARSTDGALRIPTDAGAGADGGWLAREKLPPAGAISVGLGAAGPAGWAAGLALAARTASPSRR